LVLALVLGAILASPAWAAFPGRDGLLAVQPVSGPGIVLVNAHGGAKRRICTSTAQCGTPRTPRWSPNGRVILFDGATIHLIYPDGSCLDCTIGGGGTPAFTGNPTLITLQTGGKLVEDGIDGIRKAPTVVGNFSDAVWSSRGQLAVVRGGSVWAGSPQHLRRVAAGGAPSWSPSGAQLAIGRGGSIFVVAAGSHASKRLIGGGAPAWSPDGKSIAFIGAGRHLMIVSASGGAAHRVGNVQGVNVDWQPVPKKAPAACAVPPGSKVLASSSSGVVTSDSRTGSSAIMGCLRSDGRERFLERLTDQSGLSSSGVSAAAVGDGYAALANGTDDLHYGNYSDTVEVFDLNTGADVPSMGGEDVACTPQISAETCTTADIDQVVVGSGGVSAAHLISTVPAGTNSSPLDSISCPSASLCVAVDSAGHLFTSTDPTGGASAWTKTSVPGLIAVTCPSVSLCVGVTQAIPALGGTVSVIYTSTDPTGGASAWNAGYTANGVNSAFSNVACASVSLCVATSDSGDVVTSTNPAGGATAWTAANVDGTAELPGISCPSVSLCVATDENGNVITSTNPTGGASAWQSVNAVTGAAVGPQSLSCPSSTLCVGLGPYDDVFTSVNPTAAGSWTPTATGLALNAIACPSTSLCLAVGGEGALDVSTDPAASSGWIPYQIDNNNDLHSIACASITLCVAGDAVGNVVSSSSPTGGATAWTPALIDGDPCSAETACTTEQIVAKDSSGLHVLDTVSTPGTSSDVLTGLTLSGDTLHWKHAGSPESATLH
jgi:hypothetical protein